MVFESEKIFREVKNLLFVNSVRCVMQKQGNGPLLPSSPPLTVVLLWTLLTPHFLEHLDEHEILGHASLRGNFFSAPSFRLASHQSSF